MTLSFTKMNGAGNDFVLVDNRDLHLSPLLTRETIARLCDRHRGVGADGLLAVEPPQNNASAAAARADFRMRYYNADGGEAEMCGNGARCFSRFAARLLKADGGPARESVAFETQAGLITATLLPARDGQKEQVRLAMSTPHSLRLREPLALDSTETLAVSSVNTGVPHAVVVVDDLAALEAAPVTRLGAALRYHAHFAPAGTNANFIAPDTADNGGRPPVGPAIAIRTYERGVEDETLACGTGVVASALVYHELTGARPPIAVRVRGGDTLTVHFEGAAGAYRNVTLTGPADFVFEGTVDVEA